MEITVQLTHPGKQKPFSLNKGYYIKENQVIREWNGELSHYRKFIQNSGFYIDNENNRIKDELLFWGEWEGESIFQELSQNNKNQFLPNGIHKPIHLGVKNWQNTDPYVFGNNFYYAICKQTGKMLNLENGSLILFGTAYSEYFVVDCVFVINSSITANEAINNLDNFSETYIDQTLERLYKPPTPANKLYKSVTWKDDNTYFSFVPSKSLNNTTKEGFERLKLDYNITLGSGLCTNKTAKKFLTFSLEECKLIWNKVAEEMKKQGFVFGIEFLEPTLTEREIINTGIESKSC